MTRLPLISRGSQCWDQTPILSVGFEGGLPDKFLLVNLLSRIFTKRDTRVTCLFSVGCAAKHAAGAACIRVVCCSLPSSRHPRLLRRCSLPLGNVESSVFCLLLPLPSSRHPRLFRRRSLPLGNTESSVSCLLLPLSSSGHPRLLRRRSLQAPQKALSASLQCREQCLLPFTMCIVTVSSTEPNHLLQEIK